MTGRAKCIAPGCDRDAYAPVHRRASTQGFHSFQTPPGTRWSDTMDGIVCQRCGRFADVCRRCSGQGVACDG